jgi:nitrous-oxide reductase
MTFLYFDRWNMRWDGSRCFQIELPPYVRGLASVGWGPSDGLAFCNSFGIVSSLPYLKRHLLI